MKWYFIVGPNFIPVGYLLAYEQFRVEMAKTIPDGPAWSYDSSKDYQRPSIHLVLR